MKRVILLICLLILCSCGNESSENNTSSESSENNTSNESSENNTSNESSENIRSKKLSEKLIGKWEIDVAKTKILFKREGISEDQLTKIRNHVAYVEFDGAKSRVFKVSKKIEDIVYKVVSEKGNVLKIPTGNRVDSVIFLDDDTIEFVEGEKPVAVLKRKK